MPAHPHAYDDLAAVYHEETSGRKLFGWGGYSADRFNNRRAALAQLDGSPDSEMIPDQARPFVNAAELFDVLPAVPRKTTEETMRASQRGGAANKARWAAIKAAQKAAA